MLEACKELFLTYASVFDKGAMDLKNQSTLRQITQTFDVDFRYREIQCCILTYMSHKHMLLFFNNCKKHQVKYI